MAGSKYTFKNMQQNYKNLIASAHVLREADAIKLANKIILDKKRYLSVEEKTGIHWALIAAIHVKESSRSWTRNLCNGEPLNQVTKWVPRGKGPWISWEASAVDAVLMQKRVTDQIDLSNGMTLDEMLFWGECYNGLGYLSKGINSPYLWAGTNHYTKGGYVSDGHYNPDFVVKNLGLFTTLWGIRKVQGHLDESISELLARPTFETLEPQLFNELP